MTPKFMRLGAVAPVFVAIFLAGCVGDDPADCWKSATCKETPVAAPPAAAEPDPAPTCDPAGDDDPKVNAACINNEIAVFVDVARGQSTNPGTMKAPVKTITHALTFKKARVYICGSGAYLEAISLSQTARIFGGINCETGEYSGVRPKIVYDLVSPITINVAPAERVILSDLDVNATKMAPIQIYGTGDNVVMRRLNLASTIAKTYP